MAKYRVIGEGANCPRCKRKMQTRSHPQLPPKKAEKQPYYFSQWDFCSEYTGGCGHVQHYEKFKVYPHRK